MSRTRRSRGASVLAALVLVAILGFVSLAVSSFSGPITLNTDASAQLAQSAATATSSKTPLSGDKRCFINIEQKKGSKEAREGLENPDTVCVPGCLYKIYVPTAIKATDLCKDEKDPVAKKNCETFPNVKGSCDKLVQQCDSNGKCRATTEDLRCAVAACTPGASQLGQAAQVPEYFKNDKSVTDLLALAKNDPSKASEELSSMPSYIQEAFNERKQEEISSLQEKRAQAESMIERLGNSPSATDYEKQLAEYQEQTKKLSQVSLDDLRANAQTTQPDYSGHEPEGGAIAQPPKYDQFGNICATSGSKRADSELCGPSKSNTTIPPPRPDPRKDPGGGDLPPGCSIRSVFPIDVDCSGNSGGGGVGGIGQSILGALARALGNSMQQGQGPACASDPNAYAQQQQQYNMQLQQYNLQLQQYNYQQYYGGAGYGAQPPPPRPPTPCTPSNQQQCSSQPQQPPAAACTAGTWRPVQNGACITSWQCVPGGSGNPTAQLSCQPLVADVGMSVAVSFACANATASSATGFSTGGALSGSATTTVATSTTNTNVLTLTCSSGTRTVSDQCTVQIAKPSIVLVANPKAVKSGEGSTIGWITSGMRSCIVSSPEQADFTARNASNTSVNGMATTSPITAATNISLDCETLGGGSKQATTTITLL